MLFNQISTFSVLAFAATSFAASCVPNKTCSNLPRATVTSCSSAISAKKLKYSTCTVWKTVTPAKVTKTVTINQPKVTVIDNKVLTNTVDETGTVSVFSTLTEYSTTVYLDEMSEAVTETATETFEETATETETSIIFNYGFALKKRVAPCTTVAKQCSCLLTRTKTNTLTAKAPTTYKTKTMPRETVTRASTATVSVTVITFYTTVVYDTATSVESQYSTATITATATVQESVTNTDTITATVSETLYTCVDPNRARCGNYCYRTQIDWYNCGGCGQRCNNGQICNGGRCIS
ncbi:hypothetical protein AOL_s00185g2 [Orbilia oligospora ATCC 24927]|uniref:Uncharacterized protein n=1 Tax=Arthrobotrys oligospora (strain ATCC 24927 / CBS 115.81 / DSM 1491) TaxID=756982 RepID=G1XPY7_ARTOA|nr:hypothetical protein AOL_s00185g2 [Orbilia oligospora ATCC 24927]EGX44788.1 hypothetical protein AOL_s00185g2 [Orbilia oligospora ATCC 24927]